MAWQRRHQRVSRWRTQAACEYQETEASARRAGSGRPRKVTGTHQNDSFNRETKNERGCAPHTQFRFVSFPSNFRFGFVPYRVSVQAFWFRFVSVSSLHRLRATETECKLFLATTVHVFL